VNPVPHAKERLLYQIFRDAAVAHHSQNQGVRNASVAIIEFREGLRIPPLHARDETAVILHGVYCQKYWKQHHAKQPVSGRVSLYIRVGDAIKISVAAKFLRVVQALVTRMKSKRALTAFFS
jgi:hypothetical protein